MHQIFAAQTANSSALYGLKVGSSCDVSLDMNGTWDSAVVTVQVSNDSGATFHDWYPDAAVLTFTANKQVTFAAGPGQKFRFVVTNVGAGTTITADGGGDHVELIRAANA
jgi:hypothetical protein